MKRIKSFIAIGVFSLAVLGLPLVASAQWRDQDNGYWSGNASTASVRGTVQSLQNRARSFDREVSRIDDRKDDRSRDRTGRDRYDQYDNLDRLASQFKNASENLANEVGRGRGMNNSRDEAQRVLSLGSQIDQLMYDSRNRRNNNRVDLQNDWRQIDRDLQTISRAYGLNYQSRNGGWRDRLPF